MKKQVTYFTEKRLSPHLCGCRKGIGKQKPLIFLIEKWKKIFDQKGYEKSILMDLIPKAFDTLNHDLLLANLYAYGSDQDSPKVLHSYLNITCQRTKISKSLSSWSKIISGIPQGSTLVPLPFNIYNKDSLYVTDLPDACNFADNTTFHTCDSGLETLVHCLEHDANLPTESFDCNYMIMNEDKCHLSISGHKSEAIWAKIGQAKLWESIK